MDLSKKISFSDFKKANFALPAVDNEYLNFWNERSFFSQMLDAWGEMDYTVQSLQKGSKQDVLQHANAFHDVCCLIYANPNIYPEEKETLKYAEWEFLNYVLWGSKDKSAIEWFNQWNRDINYELL